jgi:iron complex outermembrane receptor protein
LDRRLRINGTVFHTIYKDLQVAQFAGVFSGSTRNASAKYTGFELELTAKPVSAVGLDASLGYVKPRYKQFPYPDLASPGTLKNYANQAYFPYVPNWSVHLGGDYTVPLDFGRLILRGDYSYSSKRHFFALSLPNANPLNEAIRDPGQNLLSARLSLSDVNLGSSKLEASVFGENLLNDQLRTSGIDFGSLGFAGVTYGMPRRWGVEVKLDF